MSNGVALWNWEKTNSPDPEKVWQYLINTENVQELRFSRESLSSLLHTWRQGGKVTSDGMSLNNFIAIYKNSVEYSWLVCCALLGYAENINDSFLVNRTNTVTTLTVLGTAVEKIRARQYRDVHRAKIIPEVLAQTFYDFWQLDHSFELAMDEHDLQQLASNDELNILVVTSAEFVRGKTKSSNGTNGVSPGSKYYEMEGNLHSYGFCLTELGRSITYRGTVGPYGQGGDCSITTYLCQRDACEDPDCPDYHFELAGEEARDWRDSSIAPYVLYQERILREITYYDDMVLIASGVKFATDLLGVFLSLGIRMKRQTPDNYHKNPAVLVNGANLNLGHLRFLMMDNLATEIADEHRQLSDARKRHGEMLSLLNPPIERLRQRVMDAIDDARRITQIIQGPHMLPLTQSPVLSKYFEDGRRERIGDADYEIAHQPGFYTTLAAQAAVLSAVILVSFGEKWRDDDGPVELFQRATLCLTNQNLEHEALLKIYRVITGLGDLTLHFQIRDKLREPGPNERRWAGSRVPRSLALSPG